MQKNNALAVIFGGDSAERGVSIITGVLCCNLLKAGYCVIPVFMDVDKRLYTSRDMFSPEIFKNIRVEKFTPVCFARGGIYSLKKGAPAKGLKLISGVDCILNCCHGGAAEGGAVAAMAALQGVPLASPDMYSSALAMDKALARLVAEKAGVPVVEGFCAAAEDDEGDILSRAEKTGYPLIVKPARAGSSLGVGIANDESGLLSSLKSAFKLDKKAVVERYLADKADISCAAYEGKEGIEVSPAVVTYAGQGIYGFRQKYSSEEDARTAPPADIGAAAVEYTKRIYKAFGLFGMARTDFLLSGGRLYFCEVNSVPGSLCYGLFTRRFSVQRKILEEIITLAMERGGKENEEIIADIINKNEIILPTGCKMS